MKLKHKLKLIDKILSHSPSVVKRGGIWTEITYRVGWFSKFETVVYHIDDRLYVRDYLWFTSFGKFKSLELYELTGIEDFEEALKQHIQETIGQ